MNCENKNVKNKKHEGKLIMWRGITFENIYIYIQNKRNNVRQIACEIKKKKRNSLRARKL